MSRDTSLLILGEDRMKKSKHIGVRFVLAWIFGVLFILVGAVSLADSVIGGLLIILGAIIILPPFGEFIEKKYHYHPSGWLKLVLFLILVGIGTSLASTAHYGAAEVTTYSASQETTNTIKKLLQKVKGGTIIIDKATVTLGNLYPIRITIVNAGDVSFKPQYDIYAIDSSGTTVCEGSALFSGLEILKPGEKRTEEIQILGCIFNKDGDYTIEVDMLDEDFNKIASAEKMITVNFWGQFEIN